MILHLGFLAIGIWQEWLSTMHNAYVCVSNWVKMSQFLFWDFPDSFPWHRTGYGSQDSMIVFWIFPQVKSGQAGQSLLVPRQPWCTQGSFLRQAGDQSQPGIVWDTVRLLTNRRRVLQDHCRPGQTGVMGAHGGSLVRPTHTQHPAHNIGQAQGSCIYSSITDIKQLGNHSSVSALFLRHYCS